MNATIGLIGGLYIIMITGLWLILNRINKIEQELYRNKRCNSRIRRTLLRCIQDLRKLKITVSLIRGLGNEKSL